MLFFFVLGNACARLLVPQLCIEQQIHVVYPKKCFAAFERFG